MLAMRVSQGKKHSHPTKDEFHKGSEMAEVFFVKEGAARQMLVFMGFSGADSCSVKRTESLLNRLATLSDEVKEPEGEDLFLFRNITKALEEGNTIAVEEEMVAVTNGEVVVEKKEKKVKTKVKKKEVEEETPKKSRGRPKKEEVEEPVAKKKDKKEKPVKEEKEPIKLDRFGMRMGTKAAKVNAAIGKRFKTKKEILEESGVEGRINVHMKKLVDAGYVIKSEDGKGYAVKPAEGDAPPKEKRKVKKEKVTA